MYKTAVFINAEEYDIKNSKVVTFACFLYVIRFVAK